MITDQETKVCESVDPLQQRVKRLILIPSYAYIGRYSYRGSLSGTTYEPLATSRLGGSLMKLLMLMRRMAAELY